MKICVSQAKNEIVKTDQLNLLGDELAPVDFKSSYAAFTDAEMLARKNNYKKGEADALSHLSMAWELQGNHRRSLSMQIKSLQIREAIRDTAGISNSIHYIGDIYQTQGELSHSPENSKELTKKALEHFYQALRIAQQINDRGSMANSFNCMGSAFRQMKQADSALVYYHRSNAIRRQEHNIRRLAQTYSQMGKLFMNLSRFDSAQIYLDSAAIFGQKTDYIRTNVKTLTYLAELNLQLGQYEKALDYCKKAQELGNESGFMEWKVRSRRIMYEIYSDPAFRGHDPAKALNYYKLYVAANDSINSRNIEQAEQQYEFEKQEAIQKAEQEKKDLQQQAAERKQRTILYTVLLTLVFVSILLLIIFRSLRQRNIQNKIITEQKQLVEDKQHEILSSIQYALRIQTAILPPVNLIRKHLPGSFVLYLPKDIVAGDFYWMEHSGQSILLAACDCTGHGVPGAMVSVVCNNALSKAVHEFNLGSPADILDKTAQLVVENFSRSEQDIRDGMDASLCAIDPASGQVSWSGANNPIWIFRKGEMEEIKADKQPIGLREKITPFTEHKFRLAKGDRIYIFTDGFADQFGESTGKKLTKKRFRDLLLSIQDKAMNEQEHILRSFISSYRGSSEQTDDILVIGYEF